MPHRREPSPFDPYMPQVGCGLLLLMLFVMCLLPLFVFDAMETALRKLHLSPPIATLTVIGILVGGFINLPLYRVNREEAQPVMRGRMLPGLGWVPLPRASQQTIVALNVGGCLIPLVLAIYQARYVLDEAPQARWALAVAAGVNIVVCYTLARPIPGLGIAIPAFVPPAVAVLLVWLLLHGEQYDMIRAPVAFVSGVAGPLIGADLFNLRRFHQLSTGIVSIGGAGTFDGIVISGLAAAFFA
jgi:uncharacterized membrane protein